MSEQPDYDDGTRWDVDADVIAGWRGDFARLDRERHLHSVPKLTEPPDEPWRHLDFMAPGA